MKVKVNLNKLEVIYKDNKIIIEKLGGQNESKS